MDKENSLTLPPRTQREKEALRRLALLEDLAAKKAGIYARLLTDTRLAKDMQTLAQGHEDRKTLLTQLLEEVAEQ